MLDKSSKKSLLENAEETTDAYSHSTISSMPEDQRSEKHAMTNHISTSKLHVSYLLKSSFQERFWDLLLLPQQSGFTCSYMLPLNISRVFNQTCSLTGMSRLFQLPITLLSSELRPRCMNISKKNIYVRQIRCLK